MELLKIYIRRLSTRGFTFIEVIVVIALIAIIAQVTLASDISFYQKKTFNDEVNSLYLLVMRARIASMHNVCFGIPCVDGKSHGVHIEIDRYVLFQGSDFSGRDVTEDEIVILSSSVSLTSSGDVVFKQLSGNTNEQIVTVTDSAGRVAQILISEEGRLEKQ